MWFALRDRAFGDGSFLRPETRALICRLDEEATLVPEIPTTLGRPADGGAPIVSAASRFSLQPLALAPTWGLP
jgi:hypothetical protein